MNFQSHFPRIVSLPIAGVLFIIGAAGLRPTYAAEPEARTDAELYVLKQVDNGEQADLYPHFTLDRERELSGSFLRQLLIRSNADRTHPRMVWITGAIITGELDLSYQEIPYDVGLSGCTFADVSFYKTNFERTLDLSFSTFESDFYSKNAKIGSDLHAEGCTFRSAQFDGMRVGGALSVVRSKFIIDEDGVKTLRNANRESVSFVGAQLGDVFLDECSFENASTLDFTRMRADFISLDAISRPPRRVKVDGMTFNRISPVNWEKLQFLLSHYDPEFYTAVENSFRTHGYAEEADKVFIAKKQAERRENCKDFLRQCNRGEWGFSLIEDLFLGYGKRLQKLLYWSVVFLVIGIFVFRREKGMRIKDAENAEHYEGRYNPIWYSLDLFLPIIKLGEADVWTPKDNRRWANRYRKVHIIIGSLFVPIGLAALTGIIK